MTLRYVSRRTDATFAAALAAAAAPAWAWANDRLIVHEGVAVEAVGTGPRRCQQVVEQVRSCDIQHEGPGPGPLWAGALAFDEDHDDSGAWSGFPSARFRLPRRQLAWDAGVCFETTLQAERADDVGGDEAARAGGADVDGAVEGQRGGDAAGPFPCIGQAGWHALVDHARREIHAGSLTKVVIARAQPVRRVDPRHHVLALRERREGTTFLFEEDGRVFYGCTPETLVRLRGRDVRTHALAGSMAMDADGAALLASDKDVLEHELVAAFVRERLVQAGVQAVQQGSRGLLRLRDVQHLETPVHGAAPPGAHILDLASALHPTPAVCGTPRRKSLEWIRANEGWPRGWYAGAVGWFDTDGQGELAVALRCALQGPDGRYAFAGAGIVAGSEADSEWQETEAKLATMREVP